MYLNLSKDIFDKENKENLKLLSKKIIKSKNKIRQGVNPFRARSVTR